MQLRNPIRSGEMIKGEVSAGCEWREQRQLPAPRSPHPARLGRRGGQSNRRSAIPDLDSQIRGAELGDSPLFPPPRTLPLPPDSDSDSGSGSGGFSGPRLTAQLLLPGEATRDPPPPARATTTVNFFSIDRAEPELRPRPPGTPTN